MSDEVWWTRCEKCGEFVKDHLALSGGRLACPQVKLADVRPIRPTKGTPEYE